jgi:AcrR family transcriptional regulator
VVEDSEQKQKERADRILNAAADLVLRWGYKRVTIEEIAKRAGIGKGTVYLHWKTREALFIAMLAREALLFFDLIISRIRADPAEALLHRLLRLILRSMSDHALLRAAFSRDTEVLGNLASDGSARPLQGQKIGLTQDYYEILRSHGLLRADLSAKEQFYAVSALVFGFYVLDPVLPPGEQRSFEDRAEILAVTARNAFEPPDPADPAVLRAVAPQVIAVFERLRQSYARFAQGSTTVIRDNPEE